MSRSRARGEAWVVCRPFGGVECRGHVQYPAFAADTVFALVLQKWQLGFLAFLYLIQNLSQLCMQAVIFSPV